MKLLAIISVWFLLNTLKYDVSASVFLKSAYNCPGASNPMPILLDVIVKKTFPNNTQLTDVKMAVPFAIGTNTLATLRIERKLVIAWVTLFATDDKKGMCDLFMTYGQKSWSDLQKQLGMTPNTCPIPKGKYHTDHYLLDLSKEKLPPIPPGNYRATLEVFEKSNNRLLLCKMFDIEDRI